jgi:hypothetical protein
MSPLLQIPTTINQSLCVNQQLKDLLVCGICKHMYKDPVIVCSQGHCFCRGCMNSRSKCPSPLCKCNTKKQPVVNMPIAEMVKSSIVYCYTRMDELGAVETDVSSPAAATDERDDEDPEESSGSKRKRKAGDSHKKGSGSGSKSNGNGNGSSSGSSSSSSSSSSASMSAHPQTDHCTWEGRLDEAEDHFYECPYAGVQCQADGCGAVVYRKDFAGHAAVCQYRPQPCGFCGRGLKFSELAPHHLVCVKRQVDCNNPGCDVRVPFIGLTAHRTHCLYEQVGCPFADIGCTARILRKDVEAHERDDSWMHNRLLHRAYKDLTQQITPDDDVITLRVRQEVLLGRRSFMPRNPQYPSRLYSEDKVVEGHTVRIYVETKNDEPGDQEHYGVYLSVLEGPFPCKATWTFELVHYDGDPQSSVRSEVDEDTFTEPEASGVTQFIRKTRLAAPDNNPYVKDGYLTFKCTCKFTTSYWVAAPP